MVAVHLSFPRESPSCMSEVTWLPTHLPIDEANSERFCEQVPAKSVQRVCHDTLL
jgi:hypothetical protein